MPLTLFSKVPGILSLFGFATSALQARFLFQWPVRSARLHKAISGLGAEGAGGDNMKRVHGSRKVRMSQQSAMETRALALTVKDLVVRRLLLRLAERYERVS